MTRKTLSPDATFVLPTTSLQAPEGLKLNHSDEVPDEEVWEPIPVNFLHFQMDEDGLGSGTARWEPNGWPSMMVSLREGESLVFGNDGYLGGQLITVGAYVSLENGVVWIRQG